MAIRRTAVRKIKIMISSQCNRDFPSGGRTLTEIRKEIRDHLEAHRMFGTALLEVWINEDAASRGTDANSLEACLAEVRKADILIVLNAGHGGWAASDGDIGICHAEAMTAHNSSPAKIRVVPIVGSTPLPDELSTTNDLFRAYMTQINPFAPAAKTEADLKEKVYKAVVDAVASLVGLGVREAGGGGFASGDALTWSRLSFEDRAERMRSTMLEALVGSGGRDHGGYAVEMEVGGGPVMLQLHASPARMSVAASREIVGRPFLTDHRATPGYPLGVAGPMHLIACQSGITEAQARTMLGIPDATIVAPTFGIFAADEVQQVQLAMLRNCRDQTTVRSAVHRLRSWLVESGEDKVVLERARRRRFIADAIAAQLRPLIKV